MALSDLAVYSEYAYSTYVEVLQQQLALFNAATNGAFQLATAANRGDFNEEAFWAKIPGGVVRRRNAYGTGAIAQKTLNMKTDTSVKVASGTYEILMPPSQMLWIQQNPEVQGAVLGQQLAVDMLAEMVNTAIGVTYAAMVQSTEIVTNVTAASDTTRRGVSWRNLIAAMSKFGDASSRIGVWVMHSMPVYNLYDANVVNANGLFNYGTVNVVRDPFGRIIVMTDSPNLITTVSDVTTAHILGLTEGACRVEQNNDFIANEQTVNGQENIMTSYQAEWSFNVDVKGYSWDKANGGKSPTDAALFTSTNWDRNVTDKKDLPGVILEALVS